MATCASGASSTSSPSSSASKCYIYQWSDFASGELFESVFDCKLEVAASRVNKDTNKLEVLLPNSAAVTPTSTLFTTDKYELLCEEGDRARPCMKLVKVRRLHHGLDTENIVLAMVII